MTEHATWTAEFINSLPDESFAVVIGGGEKDEDGLTIPKTLRKLPHHPRSVRTGREHDTVDLPHLRNALARVGQVQGTAEERRQAEQHLELHATALGVGGRGEESSNTIIYNVLFQDPDGYKAVIKHVEDKLIVEGARIFRANTPMKEELIYTPEELEGAVRGEILFDIDHNFLAIGEDDKLLGAHMDEDKDFLLGDMQFASPTIIGLVESGALNGVSIVTRFDRIEETDEGRFPRGVTIPAISLTNIPYCGSSPDSVVSGCGILQTHIHGEEARVRTVVAGVPMGTLCQAGMRVQDFNKKRGGENVKPEEFEKKVSALTAQKKELESKIEAMKKAGGSTDKTDGFTLESPEVKAHTDKAVEAALKDIDIAGKLEEALEHTSKDSKDTKGVSKELTAKIDEIKQGAIEAHQSKVDEEALSKRKEELVEKHKDCEHTVALIKGLATMKDVESFEASHKAVSHRLSTEGSGPASELAALTDDYYKAMGRKVPKPQEAS